MQKFKLTKVGISQILGKYLSKDSNFSSVWKNKFIYFADKIKKFVQGNLVCLV